MIKRMIIMLVLVGVALGSIFGFKSFVDGKIKQFMAGMGNQPQTVSTTKATVSDWQPQIEAVGSLRAVNGSDLSLELAGVVEEINFQSGDDVEAGKVLLKLRDADDVAKLKSLQAIADLSQITYDRDVKQFAAKVVAKSVVDNDEANLRNNRAQVAQQQAIVDKKTLRAPFAGHLGIRQVDLGQYLAAGTAIVTLQALDPIYLDFLLPQQSLDQIKVGQPVKVKVDTYPNKIFFGKVSSINPRVETSTRNVQVRATLTNVEHKLLPGMFATVDIDTGSPQKLVTLPQTAISYNPYGNLVYVVDDKGKGPDGKPRLAARQTFVTTGATRGDQVAVLKGVKEGDVVVTGGQMKLRNGVPVVVNNSVLPKDDPNPKPADQ
ncbi:MAG TPA: efflux RND transporter periplasmic adaptor subunit [Reyranella sp.]|jgi:membrane fusion protein (multidrug efflux system)|nr:efflux RND transporter periplasmic adaptor subunit [Reyranella sp.]